MLITLAIIGVVAAITIPVLSSKIQDVVLKNQFKKAYSTLYNAIFSINTENGRPMQCFYWLNEEDKPCKLICPDENKNEFGTCITYTCEDGSPVPKSINGPMSECTAFYNELFSNRLKVVRICNDHAYEAGCLPADFRGVDIVKEQQKNTPQDPNQSLSDTNIKNKYPVYVLSNGMYLIKVGSLQGTPYFVLDINGLNGPNKWGYDIFDFVIKGDFSGKIQLYSWASAIENGGSSFNTLQKKFFNN